MTAARDRRPAAPRRLACLSLACLLLPSGPGAFAETATLTTFYPAPSGVYTQLITTQNAFLARDGGNVGIGTSTPGYKLDVNGGVNALSLNVGSITGLASLNVLGAVTAGSFSTPGMVTTKDLHANADVYIGAGLAVNTANSSSYRLASAAGPGQFAGYFMAPLSDSLLAVSNGVNSWAGNFNSTSGNGVLGQAGAGYGGYFLSTNGTGLYAQGNNGGFGVYGYGANNWGGVFYSPLSNGLLGESGSSSGASLDGYNAATGSFGLIGYGDWGGFFEGYPVPNSGEAALLATDANSGSFARLAVNGWGGYWGMVSSTAADPRTGQGGGAIISNADGSYYSDLLYAGYGVMTNLPMTSQGMVYGSDRRLKDNVAALTGSLSKVLALKPVRYTWKPGSEQYKTLKSADYGFIAQDVEPIVPEVVRDVPPPARVGDAPAALNETLGVTKGIDYARLVPLLTGAIQDQQALIERQRAQLDGLQERLRVAERRLQRLDDLNPPTETASRR